jgi:hypothetical protein
LKLIFIFPYPTLHIFERTRHIINYYGIRAYFSRQEEMAAGKGHVKAKRMLSVNAACQ